METGRKNNTVFTIFLPFKHLKDNFGNVFIHLLYMYMTCTYKRELLFCLMFTLPYLTDGNSTESMLFLHSQIILQ